MYLIFNLLNVLYTNMYNSFNNIIFIICGKICIFYILYEVYKCNYT